MNLQEVIPPTLDSDLDIINAIKADFQTKNAQYEQSAQYIAGVLLKTPGVHSVRYRIKDPNHLAEKIARKKRENSERVITLDKYEEEITDLAGVRVLHLFKGDWQAIHAFIQNTWILKEPPTAYYREGDSQQLLEHFESQGCEVKKHPAGYRSVHYIIKTSPTKAEQFVEIQVRTIFEEGWSEVDHKIRYPNFSDSPLVYNLLMMLNRLAGNADEMSSFVQDLSTHIENSASEYARMEQEKNTQIDKLQEIINKSKISAKDKNTLQEVAKSMTESPVHKPAFSSVIDMSGVFGASQSMSNMLGNRKFDTLGNIDKMNTISAAISQIAKQYENPVFQKIIEQASHPVLMQLSEQSEKLNAILKGANLGGLGDAQSGI